MAEPLSSKDSICDTGEKASPDHCVQFPRHDDINADFTHTAIFLEKSQEVARVGSYILDSIQDPPHSHRWYCTRTMDEIFGIDEHFEKTGENWLNLIVNREEVQRYFEMQIAGRNSLFSMDYQIRRRNDGQIRWIRGHGEIEYKEGKAARLIGTIQDITEQKNTEETLRLFLYTIDNFSDAIFWLTVDGNFDYANEQACRSLGYTREELLKLSLWDIDPQYQKKIWEENWKNYRKDHRGGEVIETVHKRKDGTIFPVEVTSTHLWEGDKELHVAVVRDLTEKKHSEKFIRESEMKTRTIIESIPIGMHFYHLEDDGRLIFDGANPAADAILGITNSRFIGKTIEEAFPPLAETEIPFRYRDAAACGKVWKTEQINYTEGKISGAFEVTAFQVEQGKMAAAFTDIRERKRTEEALSIQNLLLVTQQETSLDGILVVGETRDILYSNRRFEEMWKIPPGAIATKSDDLVIKTILDTLENPEDFLKKVSYLYTHHNES
ncbi:MAG: PAS domain S-box protein, partial [Spirochaetota bacterium]